MPANGSIRKNNGMSCGIRSRLPGVVLILLPLVVGQADAQTNPPPPAGMTQQQYDELVRSVGQSVVQTLTEKGLVTQPSASPVVAKPIEVDEEALVARQVVKTLSEVPTVLGGYSEVSTELVQLWDRLDRTASGGRGPWAYLGLLAITAAAAPLAEAGIRRLTLAKRNVMAQQFATTGGLWRVAALALLDGFAVVAVWLVVHLALGAVFAKAGLQTQFAAIVLKSLVTWRTFMLLFRLYLRPDLAAVRIAPVTDESAYRLLRLFELAVLVAILAGSWVRVLVSPAAVSAAILTNSVAVLAIFIFVVFRARSDVCSWFLGLIDEDARKSGIKVALARHWHWIALPILIFLGLARAYDAVSDLFEVPDGAILTLNIIIGLLLAETLSSFIVRRHRASALARSGGPESGRLLPFLVRAVRATIWVVAAAVLVRTWAVDVLSLVDEQGWSEISRAWTTTVVTALLAYFAWEAVHFATERRSERPKPGASGQEAEAGQAPVNATRLETLAPILRVALGIVIVVTAALTILASLGICITPLIAGASVFGLAISFGSQTLVHDIVSGLFYLADDAFRVGEYIDGGKAKGTVEGFTLRSIRLRHQSGQIHTVPFGQLGQITNFSRDWSTLKVNLRLTRDTDLDKLRKVTKKVGLAMLEDPELKDDFLEPLKLQGVADIADTATVMRFKITVRPIRPAYIQREAMKRLIAAFKEAGIEFAGAAVAIPPIGGPSMGIAAAAAASTPATRAG
ncbi:mechanosensitive ion channel family protein [Mycobacterium sp. KBS0706]|uniref:mechanosensitive ion channel family protein n=1 Tax=Mycobacterium sp. KBS0706 TaxID=2578109 RepID=UPI00163D8922|nr:mechanosensitive ion channel family protein [Mycobacterium sp. KBS0706]